MKSIYSLIACCLLAVGSWAQSKSSSAPGNTSPVIKTTSGEWAPIALQYDPGELPPQLSSGNLSGIKTRVIRMVDKYGFAATGSNHRFGIVPRLEILEEYTLEGLRKMQAVKIEFTLVVKQLDNGLTFGTFSRILTGNGQNSGRAISSALRKIPTSGRSVEDFIKQVKTKMNSYYEQNCDNLIAQADNLMTTKKYIDALSLLMSIPVEAITCRNKIQSKLNEAYFAFQDQYCQELLQIADAAVAAKDFGKALDVLAVVDPKSSCGARSKEIIARIEAEVDEKYERQYQFFLKAYGDAVDLEKRRINASVEIAKAYYASRPDSWVTTLILR